MSRRGAHPPRIRPAAPPRGAAGRRARAGALALALALGGLAPLACGDGEPPAPGLHDAPPTPAASLSIEPPTLRSGDVAVVEIAVVTPPDHALAPVRPPEPEALGPLWLLDAEALPVVRDGARWVHRTRLRVRAREPGAGRFPSLALEVEGPEGARTRLATEPHPFEVVSLLDDVPDAAAPLPYRLPAGGDGRRVPTWAAAAGGAAAALLAIAALAALRRARARRAAPTAAAAPPAPGARPPWAEALEALGRAELEADADWRAAAHRTGRALRRYVARRWGWRIEHLTGEELAQATPPLAVALRWPPVLAQLAALDALRFRPGAPPDAAERVRRAADALRTWVASSIPPEAER